MPWPSCPVLEDLLARKVKRDLCIRLGKSKTRSDIDCSPITTTTNNQDSFTNGSSYVKSRHSGNKKLSCNSSTMNNVGSGNSYCTKNNLDCSQGTHLRDTTNTNSPSCIRPYTLPPPQVS